MRKTRQDSIQAQVTSAFIGGEIPIPDGISFTTDEELMIWKQFSSVRSKDAWRDFDLVLLSKVVKMEVDLRKHQKTLDATGPIIQNKRGTFVENPLLRVIDTLQRQQLAIIRSMSLNSVGQDPRTLNNTGRFGQGDVIDADTSDLMSLLA
jgi:hypothetical protein